MKFNANWPADFRYDAIAPLINSEHAAVNYWARRDLLGQKSAEATNVLWQLPIPKRIIRHQTTNGFWIYPGNKSREKTDYNLLETYRQLGFLIEMFGFTREHPAIKNAAEYIFTKQSAEGDIRGIYGNQYSPNYTAAILELLIKAGFGNDSRTDKAFDWLESAQQNGGGWAVPIRTLGKKLDELNEPVTMQPDRTKPFSHLITGVVLRAYAAHSRWRQSETAKHASKLLAVRFFEKDVYADKNHAYDWTRFSFPFWQTDIVSSLNSISFIDPKMQNEKIEQAKNWLIKNQRPDGLFGGHLLKDRFHDLRLWHSLAVCRIFCRLK